ncbi:MAG: type II toxin-antitoxin system HipA family toxin [Porticoccus sp.]|nr:type II toxin-antitoxin system HipA family toxin [Porticoccus sp.]
MGPRVNTAIVSLWGVEIGAVTWDPERDLGLFQYMPAFTRSNIDVAPLTMPLSPQTYSFPELARTTFKGLPGLLADALPDKYGSALIDKWLVKEGINRAEFSPVDRLCYIGTRAMGALEFTPAIDRKTKTDNHPLDVAAMVQMASKILTEREAFDAALTQDQDNLNEQTLADILQVGVSAGGARAKAIIAWNEQSNEVRSGQLTLPKGFQHWLIKFDGIANNRDKELADAQGFGLIEYAYYKMAQDAGIEMSECRILQEHKRHHFMTKRFDRTTNGDKLHMQSLCALAHYDFNQPGAYSYEQAMLVAEKLDLGMAAIEQLYRRALFNIMARNQDDHVKNIAFLMDSTGEWRLAPAYDLTFAYNPTGEFTSRHQMSLNGKCDGFEYSDFSALAQRFNIPRSRKKMMIEQVMDGVSKWPEYAKEIDIPKERIENRRKYHRFF